MGRLVDFYEAGAVTAAVALTNNCTDTRWFHRAAAASSAICLTRGRLDFWNPSTPTLAARQGQVFFYLGPDPERFADEFTRFGLVLMPQKH